MKKILMSLFILLSIQMFAQISPWNIMLTIDPNPPSFYKDWQRKKANTNVTISYSGISGIDYKLRIQLKSSSGNELARLTSPIQTIPAGPFNKTFYADEFLGWADAKYDNTTLQQILRTNRFPQGNYDMTTMILGTNGSTITQQTGSFTISYPDAPSLLEPQNSAIETRRQPLFSWLPTTVPDFVHLTYKFKLVKRFQGQSLLQAITVNPPVHEADITSGSTYLYPLTALALENDFEYAWRVRAIDEEGNPVSSNDGSSEFWDFTYQDANAQLPFAQLDLKKDVAWISNFNGLERKSTSTAYTFNGSATLSLKLSDGQTKSIQVNLENLTIGKNSYAPFIFTSGKISGSIPFGALSTQMTGSNFDAQNLEFSPNEGLVIVGDIKLPSNTGSSGSTSVRVKINANGDLTGEFPLNGSSSSPLFTFGSQTAQIEVTKSKIVFPGGALTLNGNVKVFNGVLLKEFSGVILDASGVIQGNLDSNTPITIPINKISDLTAQLKINSSTGSFTYTPSSNQSTISLLFNSQLLYTINNVLRARVDLKGKIENGIFSAGLFAITNVDGFPSTEINYNWFKIALNNITFQNITYVNDTWKYNFTLSAAYSFPGLNNLRTSGQDNIKMTEAGIALPALTGMNLSTPSGGTTVIKDGVQFDFNTLAMSAYNYMGKEDNTPISMKIGMRLRLPELSNKASGELSNFIVDLEAEGGPSGLTINMAEKTFANTAINLPGSAKFLVDKFSVAMAAAITNGSVSLTPSFKLKGSLKMADGFFGCNESQTMSFGQTSLTMDGFGKISGTISNFVPPCTNKIGEVVITPVSSSLEFTFADNAQKIIFGGSANLDLSGYSNIPIAIKYLVANVNFSYDMLNNNLISLTGDLTTPFELNYPKASPLFKMAINSLNIGLNGLKVNGRATAKFGTDGQVGITLDNTVFNFTNGNIALGKITFDNGFSLMLDLAGGDKTPVLSVQKRETTAPTAKGVRINLPDQLIIDANGLALNGKGTAYLNYNNNNYSVGTAFGGLTLGFSPFGVNSGRADFSLNDVNVASYTREGFNVDADGLINTLLPEKLALTNLTTAYIVLRNESGALVSYSSDGDNIRVYTKPNSPVRAVFPALRMNSGTIPELLVNFDIRINKNDKSLASGSTISATIPDDKLDMFDLSKNNIPVKLKRFTYANNNGTTALSFGAVLTAFKQDLTTENISLTINDQGVLNASISSPLAINKEIQLHEKAVFTINTIQGSISTNLINFTTPNFDLTMKGAVKLKVQGDKKFGAAADFRFTNSGISMDNFAVDDISTLPKLDLGKANLEIKGFRVPSLSYDKNTGWDFAIQLDAKMNFIFPNTSFTLPVINNIEFNKNGLTIPRIENFTNLDKLSPPVPAFTVAGVSIQPRNFRMNRITIPSFNPADINWNSFGVGMDLAVSFPSFPANFPQNLKDLKVCINDLGYRNSSWTGSISSMDFPNALRIPFGSSGAAFKLDKLSGTVNSQGDNFPGVTLNIGGKIVLPDKLRCNSGDSLTAISQTSIITLSNTGQISGTIANFVPSCPIKMGKASLSVSNSSLAFTNNQGEQKAELKFTANMTLPIIETTGTTPTTQNLSGKGIVTLDILNGKLISGSIGISSAFSFGFPSQKQVMKFTISSASVGAYGLKFNGTHSMWAGEGTVGVTFTAFCVDLDSLNLISGSASINGDFGLYVIKSEQGGLAYSIKSSSFSIIDKTAALLQIPSSVKVNILSSMVSINGEVQLAMRVNNDDKWGLSANFENVQFNPRDWTLPVDGGKVSIKKGTSELAYINHDGLTISDILAVLPVPDTLAVPTLGVAFLMLKDYAGNALVETSTAAGGGYTLKTKTGKKVKLVVPAFKGGNPVTSPEFDIELNITTNSTYTGITGGSILVTTPVYQDNILDLKSKLGIPVKITSLVYEMDGGSYKFKAGAKVALPTALSATPIALNIEVTDAGLTGNARIEKVGNTYVRTVAVGTFGTFNIDLVDMKFGSPKSFQIHGNFLSKFIKDDQAVQTPIEFNSTYSNDKWNFTCSPTGDAINVSALKFSKIGNKDLLSLTVDTDFELNISAIISAPKVKESLSMTVENLKITGSGVSVSAVSVPTPQTFKVFNSDFTLTKIVPSYANDVFKLTLDGKVNFLKKDVSFTNFTIGTDGSVSLGTGGITLATPINILGNTDYLALTKINVANENGAYYFGGDFDVKLPVKIDKSRKVQKVSISVGTDGTVKGNGSITLLEPKTRYTQDVKFGILSLDYLAVNPDFSSPSNPSVSVLVIPAFYRKTTAGAIDEKKYIRYGQITTTSGSSNTNTTTYAPGITINMDGTLGWGSQIQKEGLDSLKLGNVSLKVTTGPAFEKVGTDDYRLKFSGKLKADFAAVKGELDFTDFAVASTGDFTFPNITGGALEVQKAFSISVTKIAYSDSPSNIWLKNDEVNKQTEKLDSVSVTVKSYVEFGGTISVSGLGEGGIEKFLVYTTPAVGNDAEKTTLVVKNAYFELASGKMSLSADFLYRELSPSGYKVILAANGKFNNVALFACGKICEDAAGKFSFGIFVSVKSGLEIRLSPALVLTGLGGGFFINPAQADLDMVKSGLGFSKDNKASLKVSPSSSLAILIYASGSIGAKGTVDLKLLLTVTDEALSLEGDAVMLNQKDNIKGEFAITVKFKEVFAEGYLNVNFNMGGGLLAGKGSLEFYVYGQKNWGILGDINFDLAKGLTNGNGNFYVGNKGFVAKISLNRSMDVWIVSIKGGLTLAAWYIPDVEWGAYFQLYLQADVLGGLISVSGNLEGILMGKPEFILAGVASFEGKALFVSWSGDISVKIKSDGIDACFGRDSEVDKLLNRAKNMSQDMLSAATDAKAAIVQQKFENLLLQPAQVAAITDSLYTNAIRSYELLTSFNDINNYQQSDDWKNDQFLINYFDIPMRGSFISHAVTVLGNNSTANSMKKTMNDYFLRYMFNLHGPRVFISPIRSYIDNMNSAVASFKSKKSLTETKLDALISQLQSIDLQNIAPYTLTKPVNPAAEVTFIKYAKKDSLDPPPASEIFKFNDEAAKSNIKNVTADVGNADSYTAKVVTQINNVKKIITDFDQFLKNNPDFINLGSNYASILNNINVVFAEAAKANLAAYKDKVLCVSKMVDDNSIISSHNYIPLFYNGGTPINETELGGVLRIMLVYNTDKNINVNYTKKDMYTRWKYLRALAGENPASLTMVKYDSDIWNKNGTDDGINANNSRWQLGADDIKKGWYDAPISALNKILDSISVMQTYRNRKSEVEKNLYDGMSGYTSKIEVLFTKRRGMNETYLDMVDNLISWKDKQADITLRDQGITLADLKTRKADLISNTKPPVINIGTISVGNNISHTSFILNWTVADSSKVIEYSFKDKYGDDKYVSLGTAKSLTLTELPLGMGESNITKEFWIRARSASGYTSFKEFVLTGKAGFGRTNYTAAATTTNIEIAKDITAPLITSMTLSNSVKYSFQFLGNVVKERDRLKLNWAANDPESDIQSIKIRVYRLSMLKKPNLTQYSTVSAIESDGRKVYEESYGKLDSITLHGLDMLPTRKTSTDKFDTGDSSYAVVLIVTNGAGLMSSVFLKYAVDSDIPATPSLWLAPARIVLPATAPKSTYPPILGVMLANTPSAFTRDARVTVSFDVSEPSTNNVKYGTFTIPKVATNPLTTDIKYFRKITVGSGVRYQIDYKMIPGYVNNDRLSPSLQWTTVEGSSTPYASPVIINNTDEALYFRYGRSDRGINLLDISEMSPQAFCTRTTTTHPQDCITLSMPTVSSDIKGYMYSITTQGSDCPTETGKFIDLPAGGLFNLTADMFKGLPSTTTKWYLNLRPVYQSNAIENNWFTFGPFVY